MLFIQNSLFKMSLFQYSNLPLEFEQITFRTTAIVYFEENELFFPRWFVSDHTNVLDTDRFATALTESLLPSGIGLHKYSVQTPIPITLLNTGQVIFESLRLNRHQNRVVNNLV